MKVEAKWAKKIGLTKIRKLNRTLIDEPIMKEMMNTYNHANQYVKLKGKQINIGEGMGRIFGYPMKGLYQLERKVTT
jgi:hypothetical protein